MTREEIVEGLKLLEDNMVYFDELQNDKGEWIDVHELLFEAIQALSQEPCDDAISRDAVLDALLDYWHDIQFVDCSGYDVYEDCDAVINELPSVTQKSGKWITDEPTVLEPYVCSECGIFHNGKYKNFCPNCGAKMVEPQESEE